ncbi:MAG: TonB-dependent receptor [Ignavibacteriae bacterium]|nr:TonB-dependent receptor [Ignavibacteriota bacterium]
MNTMRLVFLRRPLFLLQAGVLLFSLGYSVAVAQNSGAVTGSVKDDAGEPIPFANVAVLGTHFGAAGDAEGVYTIRNLPPGQYTLIASAVGFRRVQQGVSVAAGQTATQNFVLASDVLRMDAVVVTGTMTPRTKLESTVAISTLSPQDVFQANPRSTTEVLRYVPGFTRVESSGGEVNQNISVRGIMGVEYVMFMEDGLPVFPTMHTFFMNADNLFRPDENLRGVEVVRGGNSALFGSNTPGAIINFLNKTGGPEFAGSLKGTIGTEGLARYDFNFNGPLGEDWRFNFGGFYRYDQGVRNPGYPAVRGGQLKASATRLLDKGFVRLSAKVIDDRNQFILPLPFRNPDDHEFVSGFSEYGAMSTNEGNHVRIPVPNGELELPLDDGLRTKAYWLTSNIDLTFDGGWNIQNMTQWMDNTQGWNAIVPSDVVPQADYTQQVIGALQDTTGGKTPLIPLNATNFQAAYFFTNHFDALGDRIPFNTANRLLAPGGEWHVEKPIAAFQNQFMLKVGSGDHKFSAGLYFAHYTQDNTWYFTDILTDVRDNPRFVDLELTYFDPNLGSNQTMLVTKNGFRRFVSLHVRSFGQTTIFSPVIGAELKLMDKLRADIGFRWEYNNFVQTSENSGSIDLDGNTSTPYDNINWSNGTFRHLDNSFEEWAASVGFNYSLTDQISLSLQGSRAYKMPALDEYIFPSVEQARIFKPRHTLIAEGGVKYAAGDLGLAANLFWTEIRDAAGQGAEVDPVSGGTIWVLEPQPDSRSYGLELELSASPIPGLKILGAGTIVKPQTVEAAGAALTAGGIPPALVNLSGTYSAGGLSFLADWHYVGERDLINSQYDPDAEVYIVYEKIGVLPAYSYVNLGVAYAFPGNAITIALDVLNATQSLGLEEGNPRLPGARTSDFFLARPLLPRRVVLSTQYRF